MLEALPNLTLVESFNTNLPTAIFIHGWRENGKFSKSSSAIRDAYFQRGDHNAISIDWSYYSSKNFYHLAVIPQIKIISETIAERLMRLHENGYSISNFHLIGHSLGYGFSYSRNEYQITDLPFSGQMVGKIGRQIKNLSNGTLVIPRIYALDPAGKLWRSISIFFLGKFFQAPASKLFRLRTRCPSREPTRLMSK